MDELKKAVFENATPEELAEILAGKSDEEIAEFERLLAEMQKRSGEPAKKRPKRSRKKPPESPTG